jgi:hypothetical protein
VESWRDFDGDNERKSREFAEGREKGSNSGLTQYQYFWGRSRSPLFSIFGTA